MASKRLKPTANSEMSPFRYAFSEEKLGSGQDNTVRTLRGSEAAAFVIKISKQKGETLPSNEAIFASTLYKKKKYEILKTFLGDFVPNSHFVVGSKTDGLRPQVVPKSYTVQERVPQYMISDLTSEQRNDPRLLRHMYVLLLKLKNMHTAIDKVNDIVGPEADALDGKLDLGGISKYARNEFDSKSFDASKVLDELGRSPNLLVDPETMNLYCIDFDDGTWSDQKEAAKGVLDFVSRTPEVQGVIQLPMDIEPPRVA
jgi:hypothetical protein